MRKPFGHFEGIKVQWSYTPPVYAEVEYNKALTKWLNKKSIQKPEKEDFHDIFEKWMTYLVDRWDCEYCHINKKATIQEMKEIWEKTIGRKVKMNREIKEDEKCLNCIHCNNDSIDGGVGVCELDWPGVNEAEDYCKECGSFEKCNPVLRKISIATETFPSEWERENGPDSGVGVDYYYYHPNSGKRYYGNQDQYVATISRIDKENEQ